jgi:hypothetical protein
MFRQTTFWKICLKNSVFLELNCEGEGKRILETYAFISIFVIILVLLFNEAYFYVLKEKMWLEQMYLSTQNLPSQCVTQKAH